MRASTSSPRMSRDSSPSTASMRRPISACHSGLSSPDASCRLSLSASMRAARSSSGKPRACSKTFFASAGVAHYWIVDVDARTLEAFELRNGRWLLAGNFDEAALARIAPFGDIELSVGRLFLPRVESDE